MFTNKPQDIALADPGNSSAAGVEAAMRAAVVPIVRRKLRVTLDEADTSRRNQDAIDIVGHVRVILLTEIQRSTGNGAVRDLASYAAAVAANACYKYFRDRFPERTRLRNKLRYILTHDPRFALWKNSSGSWLCGSAKFAGRDDRVTPHAELQTSASLVAMLASFFAVTSGAVYFDDLVVQVAAALKIKEPYELSDDVSDVRDVPPDPTPRADVVLEWAARLKSLWTGVLTLPSEHRKALLLNLRDGTDDNLLATLPLTGVASLREVAEALEMPIEELAEIWHSLPWDDLRIAEHLGCRRQQVINLRQTARTKLAKLRKETDNI